MASGVRWNDNGNDPNSDLFRIARIEREKGWRTAMDSIAKLKRVAAPGTKFNYNTVESNLAGIALKNVIGKSLSDYLSEKVWKPFGMHADANWVKIRGVEVENGGCCISATLRDYALLGMFTLKNGMANNGKQLIGKDWMRQSLSSSAGFKGYGYYWWLRRNGRYFASGAFGQQVEMDPKQNAVIAVQSYWPQAFSDYYVGYLDAFIEAMMQRIGRGN